MSRSAVALPLPLSTSQVPPVAPSPTSPFRRKPLPASMSPAALRPLSTDRSTAASAAMDPQGRPPRSVEPGAQPLPLALHGRTPSQHYAPKDLDRDSKRFSPVDLDNRGPSRASNGSTAPRREPLSRHASDSYHARQPSEQHAGRIHAPAVNRLKNAVNEGHSSGGRPRSTSMASQQQQQQPSGRPHHLRFQIDTHNRTLSNISDDSISSVYAPRPRSPGSNMASVFDGKSSAGGGASSITSYSPLPSPRSPKWSPMAANLPRPVPMAIDVRRANAGDEMGGTTLIGAEIPISDPAIVEQVSALEEELREVSSELAASIRREMELEDAVDRLRGESIVEEPAIDHEELERVKRKAEQDKAQLRLRLTQKIQHERLKRKALEDQVRRYDEHGGPKAFEPRDVTGDAFGRIKQLEATVEETRRRLMEERRMKENYEDLLTALRAEIEEYRNERDNLRDEVVPRLRARVEGLESESAGFQRLTYEHSRTQQELQCLREELASQISTGRRGSIQQQPPPTPVFDAIAEEDPSFADPALARSLSKKRSSRSSVAGASSSRQRSLTRSNSTRDRESRESLADRVKDVEAQRDALHKALKSLLDRHEYATREHDKRVKALEMERNRLLAGSPRKGYNREVTNLREEINHLRRRADEALEQKWQCEKGLGGLKMDLDRAEQETTSLRMLLQEHDILIPESNGSRPSNARPGSVTSASLEKAYRELQTTHALALARIQALEGGGDRDRDATAPLETANFETERTMELLKKSIVDAEAERDDAQRQAEKFRLQAESLLEAGKGHRAMDEERSLSEQLRASAVRVEELAVQVRQQLDSNNQLRHRLAEAISRGERQQKSSAARITEMQGKLKALEDHLTAAQAHSEETIARHEEEVREIRESHNAQLQRMTKNGYGGYKQRWSGSHRSTSMTRRSFHGTRNGSDVENALNNNENANGINNNGNGNPTSPQFPSRRSPKLDLTTTGIGMSLPELSRAEMLEHRVQDLERALGDADREMEEVVSRMNLAQIEVMELQSQRDTAMRQTRHLQSAINQERLRVNALMG
ncbi:MAG: mediator complex subunit [Watsoniomyces obsoletus]|nr:MAG: mediator complex subunit [Watsoniomyces obsoletus]